MAVESTPEVPFTLDELKEVLTYTAVSARLYQPLRSLYHKMVLEWGDVETACATRRGGRQVITLGRRFFAERVKTLAFGSQCVLHEIMHHLFRHLLVMDELTEKGYSRRVQNLAQDAIINAYLDSVGCAGFFEEFYEDRGEMAFLRPNSPTLMGSGSCVSHEEWAAFFGVQPELFSLSGWECMDFYRRLYRLDVTLEAALEFFQKLADSCPPSEGLFVGSHNEDGTESGGACPEFGDGIGSGGAPPETCPHRNASSSADLPGQKSSGGGRSVDENFFSVDDARKTLEEIGLIEARSRRSFEQVIARITQNAQKPGLTRTGTMMSRRMPAKLSGRDMINVARGRGLFRRSQYLLKEVVIFFDMSGSVDEYVPFMVGLMRSFKRAELDVRAVCWADGAKQISYDQFLRGELPSHQAIGFGTNGEAVAKYIRDNGITQAVIITDNLAGTIVTPIRARLHVCLVGNSSDTGSFLDRSVVPHCYKYDLDLTSAG